MDRSTGGSRLKKERAISHLTKAWNKGQLVIPENETETQKWWRCEARFCLGDYSDWGGWEYRDQWAATLWHWRDTSPYTVKPWDGSRTEKLYIIGEQGVGDEVLFASCLEEAKSRAQTVIVECDPRLRKTIERSFGLCAVSSQIIGTARIKQPLPDGTTAWFPLADLPRFFRRDLSSFPGKPYLTAHPAQIERFKAYKGRTGVSWRGAQGSIPELRSPDDLSLQYDRGWDEDIEEPEGLDLRDDIEGILGLLANLDQVTTVSTSVAHFACALGIKTNVVLAPPASGLRGHLFPFKWMCEKTPGRTPWYSCATVYPDYRSWRQSARV